MGNECSATDPVNVKLVLQMRRQTDLSAKIFIAPLWKEEPAIGNSIFYNT